jgi:hypothetical protein
MELGDSMRIAVVLTVSVRFSFATSTATAEGTCEALHKVLPTEEDLLLAPTSRLQRFIPQPSLLRVASPGNKQATIPSHAAKSSF